MKRLSMIAVALALPRMPRGGEPRRRDLGDRGVAFVAIPQIPPRNVVWASAGKWVHAAKVMFEKYFMRKMRKGQFQSIYEKYVLRILGLKHLKEHKAA